MDKSDPKIRGRGTPINPTNRFIHTQLERFEDYDPSEDLPPATQLIPDATNTIITHNDSPDIGFDSSINVYRGCEHGCAYCFARPTHEFLGFSAGLDFETKIVVKYRAPELLRAELMSPKWKPRPIAMSGITDCYQPIERKLQLTRRCLEVFAEFRQPVIIITKNHLVTRDVDLLAELARHHAVSVFISITTLDPTLTPKLEPRASLPKMRLAAIKTLSDAGVNVGVLAAPMIPGLTDHELPKIIAAAAEAGACQAGFTILRLPYAVKDIFIEWLKRNFPDRKDNILNRIRAIRDGKLNDPDFNSRMRGDGIFAEQIRQMFHVAVRKAGLENRSYEVSTAAFRRPNSDGPQLSLFE